MFSSIRAGRLAFFMLFPLLLLTVSQSVKAEDAVVGTGTPASCTEAEFDAALAVVQASDGGGVVSFNCGGPATIIFTSQKTIDAQLVTINGGDEITLSGGNSTRLFHVTAGTLELRNITLTNGNSGDGAGGAILAEKDTSVVVIESTIKDSRTNDGYAGGAIFSWDPPRAVASVTIEESFILDNTSPYAAVNTIGRLIVRDSTISGNEGGGLSVGGPTDIFDSTIDSNSAVQINNYPASGGAIRIGVGATVDITGGQLNFNTAVTGRGGAVYNLGTLFLTDVMVGFNETPIGGDAYYGEGGAIFNGGTAVLSGVTLQGNRATGSVVYNSGSLTVLNSTMSDNDSGSFIFGVLYNLGTTSISHSTIIGSAEDTGSLIYNENALFINLSLSNTIMVNGGASIALVRSRPKLASTTSLIILAWE